VPTSVSPLAILLARQRGVATLAQLDLAGVPYDRVRAQVRARRWRRFGEHCILTHNFEPTREQRMWIALLDHQVPAALAGFSSLELAGFHFFGTEPQLIHVIVPRGAEYHRFPGVQIHESRRFDVADIVVTDGFPHLPLARSALDAAAWQPSRRYACGVLAAVVQQRICTPEELEAALPGIGRIRHKQPLRLALLDIAGGAEALSELDVGAMCRRFGIREPDRQRVRRDPSGRRRYLDCEWHLEDGRVVVLEVDGGHHLEVEHWESDMKRERKVVTGGRAVLRASAHEVRYEQAEVAGDLVAIGIPAELSERCGAMTPQRSDNSVR
jgi:hypothetical protein